MSGGGNGPRTDGGPDIPCDMLRFETTVNSVDRKVLREVKVKDELDIALNVAEGVKRVLIMRNGDTLGSITTQLAKILGCLEEGFEFVAVVLSKDGGACRVRVQPKA